MMRKADREELHQLEAKLMEKLNELLQKFLGMFADKKDTNKRLTNLEKNVNTIAINISKIDEEYFRIIDVKEQPQIE